MKRFFIYAILITNLFSSYVFCQRATSNAISYTLNASGRFGEHLTTYIKAKKLAKDYGLPFIYKPFSGTEALVMHTADTLYDDQMIKRRFKKTVHVTAEMILEEGLKRDTDTLYIVQWGTALKGCKGILDIQDEVLMTEIKRLIALANPSESVLVKEPNTITVALHVRKGGGYDPAWVLKQQPLRFANDEYYLEQLKRVLAMYPEQRIKIHLFTDDQEPKKLAAFYMSVLNSPLIKFIYREFGNKHNANVLDDFFAMAQCDCMIRPASCFSELAQIIGGHKIVIFPISHTRLDKDRNAKIDKVMVVTRDDQNKRVFKEYKSK